jgi:hypothetical protein
MSALLSSLSNTTISRLTGSRCRFLAVRSDISRHGKLEWLSDAKPFFLGRNIRQCLRAAELMFNMHLPPPTVPALKRKSFGDISEQLPKRQALSSPSEPQSYAASRSFGSHPVNQPHHHLQPQSQLQIPPHLQHQPAPPSLPQLQPQAQAQPVNIQPRPAPNGFAVSPSTSSPRVSSSTLTGTGRKRGRPSKADREAWARANAPQQTAYAPITPAPIAPQPAPTASHSTYSPNSVGLSAYQFSSAAPGSYPKPKLEEGRPVTDEERRSESVPRSVHSVVSPDAREYSAVDHQSKSKKQEEWREEAARADQNKPGKHKSPSRMDPLAYQGPDPERPTGPAYKGVSAHAGVIGPPMEQSRHEGQPPLANHA